jgi:hypothetical protein
MFGYIYGNGNGDDEYKQEIITDNEIFIIDNDTTNSNEDGENVDSETATDLKNKYFKCWKDSVESENKKKEYTCSYMDCGYGYVPEEFRQAADENEGEEAEAEEDDDDDVEERNYNEDDDKLNYNDTDETDCENKVYIISLNGIPYFYDENLPSLRNTMWDIANNLLKNSNSPSSNYILTNNSNEVKIISPYNFFWFFNYNHTISELKIDYVIKFPTKQEKQD